MKEKSYLLSFTIPLAVDEEVLPFSSIVFGDLSFSDDVNSFF
jgi:hypothetical protein